MSLMSLQSLIQHHGPLLEEYPSPKTLEDKAITATITESEKKKLMLIKIIYRFFSFILLCVFVFENIEVL